MQPETWDSVGALMQVHLLLPLDPGGTQSKQSPLGRGPSLSRGPSPLATWAPQGIWDISWFGKAFWRQLGAWLLRTHEGCVSQSWGVEWMDGLNEWLGDAAGGMAFIFWRTDAKS